MQKSTKFICVAIYVQTRCFIKEYGLHNYTFHYSGTHAACSGTGGCRESWQVPASPPKATQMTPVLLSPQGTLRGARGRAARPTPPELPRLLLHMPRAAEGNPMSFHFPSGKRDPLPHGEEGGKEAGVRRGHQP